MLRQGRMKVFILIINFIKDANGNNNCDQSMQSVISDANLTPGMFFPNKGYQPQNASVDNNIFQSNVTTVPQNTPQPDCTTTVNNQPPSGSSYQGIATNLKYYAPNTVAYSQPTQAANYSSYYTPSQVYYPQNSNGAFNQISPATTQPPNGNIYANICDNSAEKEQFKQCVGNALESLKSILENCRKTLGENAKECCINMDCMESLINTGKQKNKGQRKGPKDKKESLEYSGNEKRDALDEFIRFLERKLESKTGCRIDDYRETSNKKNDYDDLYSDKRRLKNKGREGNNRNRPGYDDYDDDPYDQDYKPRDKNRSRRQRDYNNHDDNINEKYRDSCNDPCANYMEDQC